MVADCLHCAFDPQRLECVLRYGDTAALAGPPSSSAVRRVFLVGGWEGGKKSAPIHSFPCPLLY